MSAAPQQGLYPKPTVELLQNDKKYCKAEVVVRSAEELKYKAHMILKVQKKEWRLYNNGDTAADCAGKKSVQSAVFDCGSCSNII